MKKLILIDGNALVHRAFHALPPLKAPDGMIANAIFGFTSVLIKTIKDMKPDYIAAAFDLAGPTFRHKEYEEYKAHRVKAPDELYAQMPIVKDVLSAFGIPIYEKEGYEADDLIGALAKRGVKEKDVQVIILTGDLDTLQLVDGKKIMVYTLKRGVTDTILYDEKAVKTRYGGISPEQLVDYRGLKGDPSDNIPGVPGVGEKTAIMLIKMFGSIEEMYKVLEDEKKPLPKEISEKLRDRLIENKDKAIFSKHLSQIVTDIDIDFSVDKVDWLNNFNPEKIEKIFKKLAFTSLIKRLSKVKVLKQQGFDLEETIAKPAGKNIEINKIKNDKSLKELVSKIKRTKSFSLVLDDGTYYIALKNEEIVYEIDDKAEIKKILEDESIQIVMHQSKDTIKVLFERGVYINNLFDTAIAAYLISPDQKDYDLEKVYFQEFRESVSAEKKYWPVYILELKEIIWGKLKEQDLIKVFEDIEMPLIPVLAQMERFGIKINVRSLSRLAKVINKDIGKLKNKILKLAGVDFNINSPQQLGEVLFEKLKLKGTVRKTSGGAKSTAAPELEKLIEEHPIIELILQYRELQKLKTTYVDPFPQLVAGDGRVHTTYNQTGTGTGRLASESPNLQNVPIKTELGQEFRKAFVADNGYVFLSFDYSQIELRVAAHLSNDKTMIKAFKGGEDIHTRTAAEIFEVPPEDVTSNMRRQAKVINFGIIYGMGILGFARAAGVNRKRAKEFIARYLDEFSDVKEYIEKTKEEVRKLGYVKTLFGRRRKITEIFTSIPEVIRQGERMAVNFPIQGGAADIMKIAMTRVADYIHKSYKKNEVRMLLQVHDELLFEIKEKYLEEFSKKVKEIMESVVKLKVPLIVDAKIGSNWAQMETSD